MEYPYAVTLTPDYLLGVEKNQFVRIPIATDITGGTPLNESRNVLTGTQSTPGGGVTLTSLDGAVIGGTTPAAGTFTNLTGTGTLSVTGASNKTVTATGTGTVTLGATGTGTTSITRVNSLTVVSTDSSGTPGNATNNNLSGRAAFAAAASTVVITNSLVTAASKVFISLTGTADATLKYVTVTAGAGTFTVTGNAAATATTVFDFLVVN